MTRGYPVRVYTGVRVTMRDGVELNARVTRPDSQSAVGILQDLPALVEKVDGGPAILIIGDVVARSAPWRHQNLSHVISELLETAA